MKNTIITKPLAVHEFAVEWVKQAILRIDVELQKQMRLRGINPTEVLEGRKTIKHTVEPTDKPGTKIEVYSVDDKELMKISWTSQGFHIMLNPIYNKRERTIVVPGTNKIYTGKFVPVR